MKFPLATLIDIKGRALKNRLGVAPMTRVTATEDGRATETMARYYERFARGGFGLVISEGIYTNQAFSQGYVFQPGISDDEQARSWSPVVAGIQAHGALAVVQIMHAGAISQGEPLSRHDGGAICDSAEGQADDVLLWQGHLCGAAADLRRADRRGYCWFRDLCGSRGWYRGLRRDRDSRRQRLFARPVSYGLHQHALGSVGRQRPGAHWIDARGAPRSLREGRRSRSRWRPYLAGQSER